MPKGKTLVLFLVYEVGTAKQDKLPRKGWGYTRKSIWNQAGDVA